MSKYSDLNEVERKYFIVDLIDMLLVDDLTYDLIERLRPTVDTYRKHTTEADSVELPAVKD